MPAVPAKRLTVRAVQTLPPGRYSDGHGLQLLVAKSGGRCWVQRLVIQGRRRDLGLGPVALVSLAQARAQARRNQEIARAGGDPKALMLAEARAQAAALTPALTVEAAARACHAELVGQWKHGQRKHGAQWLTSLEHHAFAALGSIPIATLATTDIIEALRPLWLTKAETASRVLQRLAKTWHWAQANGHIGAGIANPADSVRAGLPKQTQAAKVKHHAAIPYAQMPAHYASLGEAASQLCERWIILSAVRSGEARGLLWKEIDRAGGLWTLPAHRRKGNQAEDHLVPLTAPMLTILDRAALLAGGSPGPDQPVFPNRRGAPLSDVAVSKKISARGYTIHGHRSAFKDWAREQTDFADDISEAALAHDIPDAVKRAYQRTKFFDQRKHLMADWADFVLTKREPTANGC